MKLSKWHESIKKRLEEDPEIFVRAGRKGGSSKRRDKRTRSYYMDRDLAATVGSIGGKKSRRGYKFIREEGDYWIYENKKTGEQEKTRKIV